MESTPLKPCNTYSARKRRRDSFDSFKIKKTSKKVTRKRKKKSQGDLWDAAMKKDVGCKVVKMRTMDFFAN